MKDDICTIEGCGKRVKCKSLCYAHYMKLWRYGTPTPTHRSTRHDLPGRRYGTLVVTDERVDRFWICKCDCGEVVRRTTNSLYVSGDSSTCGVMGRHYTATVPHYRTAHERVIRLHGPASSHSCADCGKPAAHWSYDHQDPDEFTALRDGCVIPYSGSVEHYMPRCVPCHKRFDLDHLSDARA